MPSISFFVLLMILVYRILLILIGLYCTNPATILVTCDVSPFAAFFEASAFNADLSHWETFSVIDMNQSMCQPHFVFYKYRYELIYSLHGPFNNFFLCSFFFSI